MANNKVKSNMEINGGSTTVVHDDVLIEILLLLPAKSLVRFKCVCKQWYDLIRSPNFITNHFNHLNNHNRLFAFHSQPTYRHKPITYDFTFVLFQDESLSALQNIDNPLISRRCRYTDIKMVLGPVNGLYFIHYCYYDCVIGVFEDLVALWNPSTTEFRQLPFPSLDFPSHLYSHYFGFGSTDDDIKLVCISCFESVEDDDYRYPVHISLYSLVRDCWSDINTSFSFITFDSIHETGATLNGAYYWLAQTDRRDFILLFDMRKEVFREVELPPQQLLYDNNYRNISFELPVLVRNESITLFVNQCTSNEFAAIERVNVWIMKEEGCWIKIFSFGPLSSYPGFGLGFFRPGFWKDDEIIGPGKDGKLVLYNIRCHETRNLGIEEKFANVLDYKESLTSVKGGRDTGIALIPPML